MDTSNRRNARVDGAGIIVIAVDRCSHYHPAHAHITDGAGIAVVSRNRIIGKDAAG
jgi:hypothetical protein